MAEFHEMKTEMEVSKFNVQRLEGAKSWLERSLKEAEVHFVILSFAF